MSNPRNDAAIRFIAVTASRPAFEMKNLERAVRGFLGMRDIAYPDEKHLPVSRRQIFAIAHSARQRRSRAA